MKKRLAIAIVGLIIIFGGSFGFHFFKDAMITKALANYRPPPATVSAASAKQVEWRPYTQAIGTLSAVNGVDVSNAIDGKVLKIAFHSGDEVKQGQLLVKLDTSQEQALLEQYQAQAILNKGMYQRAEALRKKNLNSKQDLDTALANYQSAQAQVAGEQAVIDKKTITAPFAGQVGIREVNLGQYIAAGTAIVNLEQLTPLYVTFTLPQADVPKLHLNQNVAIDVDAYPNRDFAAKITAIDPAVNDQSRTVQVQATSPNPDKLLRPGMFANLKVLADQSEKKIVIPATAINYSLYGDSVYVLEPVGQATNANKPPQAGASTGNKSSAGTGAGGQTVYTAKQVFVNAGEQRGKLVAVTGIKLGDQVVTAGQIKLHNGSQVLINNEINLGMHGKLTP
ncbi:MAG: efflux RND transporter periplasmic adaptor subunit [Gammaproteobacteria bacterium]